MPLWDNKQISVAYPDDHGEAVLKQNPFIASPVKRATGFWLLIRRPYRPKVGVIPIQLHGVAGVTERLKVADLIAAALVSWPDVVNLQGTFLG
jgi:hypothetical protein